MTDDRRDGSNLGRGGEQRSAHSQLAESGPSEAPSSAADTEATVLETLHDHDQGIGEPVLNTGSAAAAVLPESIGPFRILEPLGEGGMGVVYLAEQTEPVERRVALKLIHASLRSAEAMARFEAERQAMARLSHPNVAQLYEAGTTDDGFPFFAMEHVGGRPLNEHCDEARLTVEERLRLFVQVCLGVQHAHQKGVLHRDLKPSNLLVAEVEGSAAPKVIDFGIAKALDEPLGESRDLTGRRAIGTPAYMSPEALLGSSDVDTRTDVYSLGVVLYELLAGVKPREASSPALLLEATISDSTEAPQPSTRISGLDGETAAQLAEQRRLTPRELAGRVRGDLDWIVMKAIADEPERRYASAAELAADVERHLENVPVIARPPSTRYRVGKFARRHRLAISAASVVLASLIVGAGLAVWQAVRATREAARANRETRAARIALRLSATREMAGDPTRQLALLREIEVDDPLSLPSWQAVAQEALSQPVAEALFDGHEDDVVDAVWSPDGSRIVTASHDHTARVWRVDGSRPPVVLEGHEAPLRSVAWVSDGGRIVTASDDGTARIWKADGSGTPIVLRGHEGPVYAAAWSPEGQRVVTASRDETARVWNADGSGTSVILRGHNNWVWSAFWSPDGQRIVTASSDRTARVWSADGSVTLAELRHGRGEEVRQADWSPDGARILTSTLGGAAARVWRADGSGAPIVLRRPGAQLSDAEWSHDGERVLTVYRDGAARVWSLEGPRVRFEVQGHDAGARRGAWSPDGSRFVTASIDGTARVWNADGSGVPTVLRGHDGGLWSSAFSPDGRQVVTASSDGTARLWSSKEKATPGVLGGHRAAVLDAELAPDGRRVVTGSQDGTARVWEVAGAFGDSIVLDTGLSEGEGERADPSPQEPRLVTSVAFSPDGSRVATAHWDGVARVWNADGSGSPSSLRGHQGPLVTAVWSPDGKRILTASGDGTARIFRADSSAEAIALVGHQDIVRSAAWSPDGSSVVTGSADRSARIWNADGSGVPIGLEGHGADVWRAVWSPDGERIATASWDRTARVWSADGSGVPLVLEGHTDQLWGIAWSPDGSRVATASGDGTARVWSLDGSGVSIVLAGHEDAVLDAAWSPDGTRIVTASGDKTVRVWNADGSGYPVVLRGHGEQVGTGFFSPDGQRILTASSDGTARVWSPDLALLLWTRTPICLPVPDRVDLLTEDATLAERGFERCQRMVECVRRSNETTYRQCHAEFRRSQDAGD